MNQADVERLKKKHGGHWGEIDKFQLQDWRYEVANDDTRLGYWEWCYAQMTPNDKRGRVR